MKICVNVTFNQKYFDIEFSTTTALKSHCFIIKKKNKRGVKGIQVDIVYSILFL